MLRRSGLATVLLLAAGAVWAAPPAVAPATPAAVPDERTLEFLADWQGADGQFVDPMTFAVVAPAPGPSKRLPRQKPPVPSTRNAPPAETGKAGA